MKRLSKILSQLKSLKKRVICAIVLLLISIFFTIFCLVMFFVGQQLIRKSYYEARVFYDIVLKKWSNNIFKFVSSS
jgi:hypothetical protein